MKEIKKLSTEEQEIVFRLLLEEDENERDKMIDRFDQEKRLRILSAAAEYNISLLDEEECYNDPDEEGCDDDQSDYSICPFCGGRDDGSCMCCISDIV